MIIKNLDEATQQIALTHLLKKGLYEQHLTDGNRGRTRDKVNESPSVGHLIERVVFLPVIMWNVKFNPDLLNALFLKSPIT